MSAPLRADRDAQAGDAAADHEHVGVDDLHAIGPFVALQRAGRNRRSAVADGDRRAALLEVVAEDLMVVRENLAWRAEQERRPQPPPLTVTEVPLLYETGADKRFDVVVVITAPDDVRRERRPRVDDREQRLLPDAEKIELADFAYVNDGTPQELDAFVAGVVARLTS